MQCWGRQTNGDICSCPGVLYYVGQRGRGRCHGPPGLGRRTNQVRHASHQAPIFGRSGTLAADHMALTRLPSAWRVDSFSPPETIKDGGFLSSVTSRSLAIASLSPPLSPNLLILPLRILPSDAATSQTAYCAAQVPLHSRLRHRPDRPRGRVPTRVPIFPTLIPSRSRIACLGLVERCFLFVPGKGVVYRRNRGRRAHHSAACFLFLSAASSFSS